ncbi:MAG: AsmA family protein, partial [Burkholderiales bacterium]
PLSLNLSGALDEIPVAITVETAPARDLADPHSRLPFRLVAESEQTQLVLSGGIARPLDNRDVELALELRGPRLDRLDRLVRASLPPWGPWSAAGKFRMWTSGYEVTDLRLQVGESTLTGEGGLRTDTARPRLDISLAAQNIQLDDFRLGEWSAVEKRPADEKAPTAEEIRESAAKASDEAQRLLSPAVLRRQDAFLKVRVEKVRSGQDQLGGGRFEAKLENGRAEIGPIEVDIPGGSAKVSLGYEPTDNDVKVDLKIDVEKFDYGILARRIKPDTDLRGIFSAHLDVASRARYLSEALRHGNGGIEFAVWPENMKSGIFDLWAVNVLVALVPAVDPSRESKVNCAVGRFQLSDGKLEDRGIVLDTTRMRVVGTGQVNFEEEKVRLRMRPQAKTAQFLSLATPVEVNGSFTDFKVGVSPGDVVETVGRVATSVVWVPLKKLFGKKIPKDGSDICADPFDFLAQPR